MRYRHSLQGNRLVYDPSEPLWEVSQTEVAGAAQSLVTDPLVYPFLVANGTLQERRKSVRVDTYGTNGFDVRASKKSSFGIPFRPPSDQEKGISAHVQVAGSLEVGVSADVTITLWCGYQSDAVLVPNHTTGTAHPILNHRLLPLAISTGFANSPGSVVASTDVIIVRPSGVFAQKDNPLWFGLTFANQSDTPVQVPIHAELSVDIYRGKELTRVHEPVIM